MLLAKIALIIPLLGIAGINAFVLKPRLVAAIDASYQQGGAPDEQARARMGGALRRLQRVLPVTIIAEIALIVGVFAVVGVLSQTSTAKGEVGAEAGVPDRRHRSSARPSESGGLKLTLDITPNRVGINQYD